MRTLTTVCLLMVTVLILACGGAADPKQGGRRATEKPPEPVAKDDWISATGKARVGDVEIGIERTEILDLVGGHWLDVKIQLTNHSTTRLARHSGWSGVRLMDEHGNSYRFRGRNTINFDTINPGQTQQEGLEFEPPIPQAGTFRLELPGAVLGQQGSYRLKFPRPTTRQQ